jgi:hypothetical protein
MDRNSEETDRAMMSVNNHSLLVVLPVSMKFHNLIFNTFIF